MQRLLSLALALLLTAGAALANTTPGNLGVATTTLVGGKLPFDQGPGTDTALGFNTSQFCIGSGALIVCGGAITNAMLAGSIDLTSKMTGLLPIANGGTGTASPGLGAGTNITITGSWPNQTINSSGSGSGTVTSIALAPGLAKTVGTRNTGSDAITTTGSIIPQLFPVTKATSYTVNADNGGSSDTGALLLSTGASVTFTLPNPASGTKGNSYQFGSDGTNGFTLTTAGGTATLYGFSGGGGTSVAFPANRDTLCVDDGTNYKCSAVASPISELPLTWAPGINPNNLPIANINEPKIIVGIRCTPEVAAGGTATIQPVKAASATAINGGTNLTSNTCDANATAATDQSLTVSVTTLAAGDRLGIKTTGTTIWTSSGIAAGIITVFVR